MAGELKGRKLVTDRLPRVRLAANGRRAVQPESTMMRHYRGCGRLLECCCFASCTAQPARVVEVGSRVEPRDSHQVPSHRPPPKPVILHQRTVSPCFNLSDALALLVPPCHVMSRRVGSSGNQEQASQPHSSLDTCSCGSALRLFPFFAFSFSFTTN
jgi:hypothetical protein